MRSATGCCRPVDKGTRKASGGAAPAPTGERGLPEGMLSTTSAKPRAAGKRARRIGPDATADQHDLRAERTAAPGNPPDAAAGRAKSAASVEHDRWLAIEKAKQEWERTADALPELVCLLDCAGHIVRANRVIEHWRLGTVTGSIGKSVHALLHSQCMIPDCALDAKLRDAHKRLRSNFSQEFDDHESVPDRILHFVLRSLQIVDHRGARSRDSFAVLVVSDHSALHQAREGLQRLNANLESRVRARTRELAETNRDLRNEAVRRERAEKALRASTLELAELSEQLIRTQEIERKRIALELHDSVGQSLSAIKYTVERALEMIRKPRLGSPESVLTAAVVRIQETAESIRAISMNLRPQILDNFGAASAVRWFCGELAEVYPNIVVNADVPAADGEIPERLITVVFRCLQELMNNVVKHAQAQNVWVVLKRDPVFVSLEVRDDGIGIATSAVGSVRARGAGFSSVRERAEMTGGELLQTSAPGSGTRVQIIWRLTPEEAKI